MFNRLLVGSSKNSVKLTSKYFERITFYDNAKSKSVQWDTALLRLIYRTFVLDFE